MRRAVKEVVTALSKPRIASFSLPRGPATDESLADRPAADVQEPKTGHLHAPEVEMPLIVHHETVADDEPYPPVESRNKSVIGPMAPDFGDNREDGMRSDPKIPRVREKESTKIGVTEMRRGVCVSGEIDQGHSSR